MKEKNKRTSEVKSSESCRDLLKKLKQEKTIVGEILPIEKIANKDVYNITAPFEIEGREYIIGRVESPDDDYNTQINFFEEKGGVWKVAEDAPIFELQDPFVTKVGDELVIGGVKTFIKSIGKYPDNLDYKTIFYRGKNLTNLEKFAEGPETMKNIRLKELPDGKIALFTRPGNIFTRKEDGVGGKIGYIEIDSLADLTLKNINQAEIIEDLFVEDEWGGASEIHLLVDGRLGVLGHIARMDENDIKHYYTITFKFDRRTRGIDDLKIIAIRIDFPNSKGGKVLKKRKNTRDDLLWDVIFPGGLKDNGDGTVDLYVGLSDKEAGIKRNMPNPFTL